MKPIWTPERLNEINDWKVKNNATWKKTAEHFGVKLGTLSGLRSKYSRKNKKEKTPRMLEVQVEHPQAQSEPMVMVMLMPLSQARNFMAGSWR